MDELSYLGNRKDIAHRGLGLHYTTLWLAPKLLFHLRKTKWLLETNKKVSQSVSHGLLHGNSNSGI